MTRVHPHIYKCPLRFVLKLLFAKSLVYTFATRGRDCARNRLLREEEDEEKKRRGKEEEEQAEAATALKFIQRP